MNRISILLDKSAFFWYNHSQGFDLYNVMMFGNIEFNKSAFKHGISKDDIHWAFFHSCYDGLMKTALIFSMR